MLLRISIALVASLFCLAVTYKQYMMGFTRLLAWVHLSYIQFFICKYLLCMHIILLWCRRYVVKKSYKDVTFGLSCTNLACSVLSA